MLQIDIVEAGAVPLLVRLLTVAQPDGQYSAAAALFNLASYSTSVQELIIAADALPALLPMLTAESWCAPGIKCECVCRGVCACACARIALCVSCVVHACEQLDLWVSMLCLSMLRGRHETWNL